MQMTLILSSLPRNIKIELPITPEFAIIALYGVLKAINGIKKKMYMYIFKSSNLVGFEESTMKLDLNILSGLSITSSFLFFVTPETMSKESCELFTRVLI